jgi:hypothetical protein
LGSLLVLWLCLAELPTIVTRSPKSISVNVHYIFGISEAYYDKKLKLCDL